MEKISSQLAGQAGEFLTGLELTLRGYKVRMFGGMFPGIDLLAIDKVGAIFPIQVKTIQTGSWLFKVDDFMEIKIEDGLQIVGKKLRLPNPDHIYVFVVIKNLEKNEAEFYLLTKRGIQEILHRDYKRHMEKIGGKRLRNPLSTTTIISCENLKSYKDRWELLEKIKSKK